MTRPTKFDKATTDKIVMALRIGCTMAGAAAHAGIAKETLYRWMRSRKTFAAEIERARDAGEVALVAVIQAAAKAGDWRAARFLLTVRRPDAFSRPGSRMSVEQEREAADIRLAMARAEARLRELTVKAQEQLASEGNHGALVLWSAFECIPEPLRSIVRGHMVDAGHRLLEVQDLGAGATDEDIARFCASPLALANRSQAADAPDDPEGSEEADAEKEGDDDQ